MALRRRSNIGVDIVHDAGEWDDLDEVEVLIEAAAAELSTEPRFSVGRVTATVVLSDDASVAALNGQFRSKPKPTNVLSFPPGPKAQQAHLGDIVLARETIEREAGEQDIPLDHHIQHLVVHGLLHLLGLDHDTVAEAERMEALEIRILARLGIANPYTGALERSKT